jgi:secreted PhoX family phosphatase
MSIPAGFHVNGFGRAGTRMNDGLRTPNAHDGMACFGGKRRRVRLLRNHEGYGRGHALGGKHRAYDRVAQGGVTMSLYDLGSSTLLGSALVVNGTDNNCNGGRTPWGSWLSCEESTVGPGEGYERKHGYVFEVPASAREPVEPVPIKAMGRFEHEACAIDQRSGIVYMTEDNGDPADGFYRYLPHDRRHLHRGGKLQMLAIKGRPRDKLITGQKVGRRLRCEWVTIDDPDPSDAEKRPEAVWRQGRAKGRRRSTGSRAASGRRATSTSPPARPAMPTRGRSGAIRRRGIAMGPWSSSMSRPAQGARRSRRPHGQPPRRHRAL